MVVVIRISGLEPYLHPFEVQIPAICGGTLEAKPLTEKEGFEPSNESLAHE